jgi:hypothetical protein
VFGCGFESVFDLFGGGFADYVGDFFRSEDWLFMFWVEIGGVGGNIMIGMFQSVDDVLLFREIKLRGCIPEVVKEGKKGLFVDVLRVRLFKVC